MRGIRRKEKEIKNQEELESILASSKYITIAMSNNNEPYLATLSHGYSRKENCIFFHCAQEGKKVDFLKQNPVIWGQAIHDSGYLEGKCDHLYATTQFKGRVTFLQNTEEKKHALKVMIHQLEPNPQRVIDEQITEKSLKRVNIGRIDIEFMSGKKADEVVISL